MGFKSEESFDQSYICHYNKIRIHKQLDQLMNLIRILKFSIHDALIIMKVGYTFVNDTIIQDSRGLYYSPNVKPQTDELGPYYLDATKKFKIYPLKELIIPDYERLSEIYILDYNLTIKKHETSEYPMIMQDKDSQKNWYSRVNDIYYINGEEDPTTIIVSIYKEDTSKSAVSDIQKHRYDVLYERYQHYTIFNKDDFVFLTDGDFAYFMY